MDDEREALGFIFVSILVTGGTVAYGLKSTSKNRPFPWWRRQPRAQILMYSPIHSGFPRAASLPSQKMPGF